MVAQVDSDDTASRRVRGLERSSDALRPATEVVSRAEKAVEQDNWRRRCSGIARIQAHLHRVQRQAGSTISHGRLEKIKFKFA